MAYLKLAVALIGCLSLTVALAAAWIGILSAVPVWAIIALGLLIVAIAVRHP